MTDVPSTAIRERKKAILEYLAILESRMECRRYKSPAYLICLYGSSTN